MKTLFADARDVLFVKFELPAMLLSGVLRSRSQAVNRSDQGARP
jgi:hypothetical protein